MADRIVLLRRSWRAKRTQLSFDRCEIQSEAEVEDSGVDVGLVLNYMDEAQNGLNIVILDACRSNPLAEAFAQLPRARASRCSTGTLIAYATAPGRSL